MNLNDYYTEPQARTVIGRSPKSLRTQLGARKEFNRWWYLRKNVDRVGDVPVEDLPFQTQGIETTDYVHLSDAYRYWSHTRERLYQVSIRSTTPQVEFINLNGRNIWKISSLMQYGR